MELFFFGNSLLFLQKSYIEHVRLVSKYASDTCQKLQRSFIDEIFFTSSSNGKSLNLTLGVNFCIFRRPHPEFITPLPVYYFFRKPLFFLPDNFLSQNSCYGALLIGLCIWQMPTKMQR